MLKSFPFAVGLFLIFVVNAACEDAVKPRLVWSKEFKTEINSVAVSSSGKHVALAVDPVKVSVKDEKYHSWDHTKVIWKNESKVFYLDEKGNIIWQYEYSGTKPKVYDSRGIYSYDGTRLHNMSMSDDGRYIACALEELYSYKLGSDGEELRLRQDRSIGKVLMFNSEGKLLWTFETNGYPRVSGSGKYVLIVPETTEEGEALGRFHFLDNNGNEIWNEAGIYDPLSAKISSDGNYILIGDTVFNKKKRIVWKMSGFRFIDISRDNAFIVAKSGNEVLFCDMKTKKVLLQIDVFSTQDRRIFLEPFSRYFIDEKRRYLVTIFEQNISERLRQEFKIYPGEVKVYDLNSGKLIHKSLQTSDYNAYLYSYLYRTRKFFAESNNRILNYYVILANK